MKTVFAMYVISAAIWIAAGIGTGNAAWYAGAAIWVALAFALRAWDRRHAC